VELTRRQREILDVVHAHIEEHGYPPTVREIGEAVGLTSSSTVHAHLQALERHGALKRGQAKPRAIDLAERRTRRVSSPATPDGVRVLPLLGRIAAGAPILAEEHVEEEIAVPVMLTASGDCFLLKVAGESMIDIGILDGDFVVVRRQDSCDDGAIVAALVDGGDATVKRLHRVAGRIRLSPENAALEPFYPDDVQVMGKVVGVFRRL
jgi:repressor LexA